jgi:hypothetical protein
MDLNDPSQLTLAVILTGGGVTATAALVWGLISMLKKLPGLGTRIDAGLEPALAYLISAILVVVAFINVPVAERGPGSGFGAFLAWYGIATIAGAAHDQIKDITSGTTRVTRRQAKP